MPCRVEILRSDEKNFFYVNGAPSKSNSNWKLINWFEGEKEKQKQKKKNSMSINELSLLPWNLFDYIFCAFAISSLRIRCHQCLNNNNAVRNAEIEFQFFYYSAKEKNFLSSKNEMSLTILWVYVPRSFSCIKELHRSTSLGKERESSFKVEVRCTFFHTACYSCSHNQIYFYFLFGKKEQERWRKEVDDDVRVVQSSSSSILKLIIIIFFYRLLPLHSSLFSSFRLAILLRCVCKLFSPLTI